MKKFWHKYILGLMLAVPFLQLSNPVLAINQSKLTVTSVTADSDGARDIIKEIIDVVGLKPRFEVRESEEVPNAAAVIYNGQRYILYNPEFVASVNNAVKTDWAAVSILAHEIGHHLNGHTLIRGGSNPADELEADEFSGFVLRKMGATLPQAQAAIAALTDESYSATHPGRSMRLTAISTGWQNANDQILASTKPGSKAAPAVVAQAEEPEQEEVSQPNIRRQATTAKLDNRSVLGKVTFEAAPREQFYVTSGYDLVRVTNSGLKVVGKLVRTNNSEVPFVFESDYFQSLYLTNEGLIVNRRGQRIGYVS
ncbi:M48 family metalloprotease [Adhaeribacter radiodurans]|uniref:Membrane-binding protein n=1 Tax=Adhaeribacter radiodurans TaxID=2745197 RepID=A0A7L7LE62_9BACT|nr:membrane-binding protein [Adhaeribacter radiodurans]QMU31100.1 membrane-binding protein [Adhaeribacter radiodurans]